MGKFKSLVSVFLILSVFLSSGCVYLKNRGHDAMQIMDVGLTVSSKPQFVAFFDLATILCLGVSKLDGKLLGIGNAKCGSHDIRQNAYGYLIGGAQQRGVDNYKIDDPNDPKWYDNGIVGYMKGTTFTQRDTSNEPKDQPRERAVSVKGIHLGWLGIGFGCKMVEMADFVLGWFLIDLSHDDQKDTTEVECAAETKKCKGTYSQTQPEPQQNFTHR